MSALRTGEPKGDGRDLRLWLVVAGVVLGVGAFALRTFERAAPDYKLEYLPAIQGLAERGLTGFTEGLPGYPAAVVLQLPLIWISDLLGLSDAATWRVLSWASILVLVVGATSLLRLARALGAPRGPVRLAAALAVGSPAMYWALRIGHPEEVLSVGLLLGAVGAAARGRPVLAGILLGAAAGKLWPIVAALPVLGLLLPDLRRAAKGAAAAAGMVLLLHLPPLLIDSTSVGVAGSLGEATIFNVGQVFWWFGDPVGRDVVAQATVPQPRVGVAWAGELSHPLILGVGTALGLLWCLALRARLAGDPDLGALREDGESRSRPAAAELAGSALLVMAGILFARCFLDTWNVPYYLMGGLVLGALGEALQGRWPLISLVATGLMWHWHPPGDPTVRTAPDEYTALYLAWTIPAAIAYVAWGLRTAAGAAAGDEAAAPSEAGRAVSAGR